MYLGLWVGKKYVEYFSEYAIRTQTKVFLSCTGIVILFVVLLTVNEFYDCALYMVFFCVAVLYGAVMYAPESVQKSRLTDLIKNIMYDK